MSVRYLTDAPAPFAIRRWGGKRKVGQRRLPWTSPGGSAAGDHSWTPNRTSSGVVSCSAIGYVPRRLSGAVCI